MNKAAGLLAAMYAYLLLPLGIPYIVDFFASSESDGYYNLSLILLVVCLLILLVAGVLNIRSAVALYRQGDYSRLRSEMKLAKLGSIPFFILEFAIFVVMSAGLSVLALFFIWTVGAPIGIMFLLTITALLLYVMLVISSCYAIAFVLLLRREGTMHAAIMILCVLALLVPILDLVATGIILSRYEKRQAAPETA